MKSNSVHMSPDRSLGCSAGAPQVPSEKSLMQNLTMLTWDRNVWSICRLAYGPIARHGTLGP